MKKIGIITITRGENYGNKLQNYAVQEVLKKLGYKPETIFNTTKRGFNTPPSGISKAKKLRPAYVLKVIRTRVKNRLLIKNDGDGILKSFIWKIRYKEKIQIVQLKRKKVFLDFSNNYITQSDFNISASNYAKNKLDEYAYFVCGSDQIWNPNYPQTSMIDFLQFAPQSKRIAYAPSFGINRIPENKKEIYRKWINEIPCLSVREEQGAKIIKELTGRDATVLVDPTLMLSKEEWLSIAKKPSINISQKYILTYFLGNQTGTYRKAIEKLAFENSCRIINLLDIRELEDYTIDPGEFIYLINNAELVCTDSFHGVVMSIILQSNFIVFNRVEDGQSMGSRIDTLLRKFDVESRLFKNMNTYKEVFEMDFNHVEKTLTIEQNITINFLSNAFSRKNEII